MTERKTSTGVTRIIRPELDGAVSGETDLAERIKKQLQARKDIEYEEHPGQALAASTADWYGGSSRVVSIEEAADTQSDLQEQLDQRVVDENSGISHHDTNGLQPCQRVRKGDS